MPKDQLCIDHVGSGCDLPRGVLRHYREQLGIRHLFEWQYRCLMTAGVLDGRNLVYSAPTSGGKTLVAEVLMCRTLHKWRRKVLMVLPYVSMVEENTARLSALFASMRGTTRTRFGTQRRLRVDGGHGGRGPRGLDEETDVLICTVEKANMVLNRLIDEERLHELGMVVLDEVHMLADEGRGYLLELLLTKLQVLRSRVAAGSHRRSSEPAPHGIGGAAGAGQRPAAAAAVHGTTSGRQLGLMSVQLIAMSATLPNLDVLARWLDAQLHVSDYRPVPLAEFVLDGSQQPFALLRYDPQTRGLTPATPGLTALPDDRDGIASLCLQTAAHGHEVLVFCRTKASAEQTARRIAAALSAAATSAQAQPPPPAEAAELRGRLLEDLRTATAAGPRQLFVDTVPVGVGVHHAGLAMEERDLVEAAFRRRTLKVLCCTKTLAAGVNLPAYRVVFERLGGWFGGGSGAATAATAQALGAAPEAGAAGPSDAAGGAGGGGGGGSFGGQPQPQPLGINDYRQMSGRAGRAGLATEGQSVLVARNAAERRQAEALLASATEPMLSCLRADQPEVARRFALDLVAAKLATTPEAFNRCVHATLAAAQARQPPQQPKQAQQAQQAQQQQPNQPEALCAVMIDALKWMTRRGMLRFAPATQSWSSGAIGRAVFLSGLKVEEGVQLHARLWGAQAAFMMSGDLHLLAMLTPTNAHSAFKEGRDGRNWEKLWPMLNGLSPDEQAAAVQMGVSVKHVRGRAEGCGARDERGVAIAQTKLSKADLEPYNLLWCALLLRRLGSGDGRSLDAVAAEFGMQAGEVQKLQEAATTFACQVRTFCEELGWLVLAKLVQCHQERLDFCGGAAELAPLLKLKHVKLHRAKALVKGGYRTLDALALAPPADVQKVLSRERTSGGPAQVAGAALARQAADIVADAARLLGEEAAALRTGGRVIYAAAPSVAIYGQLGGGGGGGGGGARRKAAAAPPPYDVKHVNIDDPGELRNFLALWQQQPQFAFALATAPPSAAAASGEGGGGASEAAVPTAIAVTWRADTVWLLELPPSSSDAAAAGSGDTSAVLEGVRLAMGGHEASAKKIGHDVASLARSLARRGVRLAPRLFDPQVLAAVLQPEQPPEQPAEQLPAEERGAVGPVPPEQPPSQAGGVALAELMLRFADSHRLLAQVDADALSAHEAGCLAAAQTLATMSSLAPLLVTPQLKQALRARMARVEADVASVGGGAGGGGDGRAPERAEGSVAEPTQHVARLGPDVPTDSAVTAEEEKEEDPDATQVDSPQVESPPEPTQISRVQ